MTALPTISMLNGVHAAAITPRSKTGDIDFAAVFELVDSLSVARVGGIALFTACGEYPALRVDERARLTYLAVKRSRVPMLAGVGSATLDHSLQLAREARAAGVAAILLPPPLAAHYDQDDIFEFYMQFAAQMGSCPPIVPAGDVALDTACRLLESGRFAGVEDCSGLVESLDRLRACASARSVLTGDDRLFVHARLAGLGVVSAAACAAPELTMALTSAIGAGDRARTERLEATRQELLEWLARFPLPVGVKTAVAARGIPTGPLSLPLAPPKQRRLEQFREWFKGWFPAAKKLAAHA